MFILKSTHNKVVSDLKAQLDSSLAAVSKSYRLGWEHAIATKNSPVVKVPVKSAQKVKVALDPKAQEKLEKRARKLRLRGMRQYYYQNIKGKIDDGYYRVENGVRISNVTNRPLRTFKKRTPKTKALPF